MIIIYATKLIVAYVRKPFLANVNDISRPIPLEIPVTTATFGLDVIFSF